MSDPSNKVQYVRIFVSEYDAIHLDYTYVKAEKIAFHCPVFYEYDAFDYKRKESIKLRILIRNFRDLSPVEMFRLSRKSLRIALDKIGICCDHFEV